MPFSSLIPDIVKEFCMRESLIYKVLGWRPRSPVSVPTFELKEVMSI